MLIPPVSMYGCFFMVHVGKCTNRAMDPMGYDLCFGLWRLCVFFEIFWTSGVLTVNFRDSIPRPMGCHENMIKIDIRDVSPHHLILLVDSYFSIKVTGNVVFFCRTSWCQLLLLCVGSGMHSMLRYYQLDLRQTDGATVPPIYSCSAFKPEFCSLLFPWCLFGGIRENAASKWPRKSGFNVNFSYNWANKHQTHHQ